MNVNNAFNKIPSTDDELIVLMHPSVSSAK